MMLSNPFVLIIVVMGLISLVVSYFNDGYEMPTRHYNSTHTTIAILVQWALLYGAITWALSH